jgi:hypothetical protein
MIVRVMLKAALLFVLCNVIYALLNPLAALGRVSLYNAVIPPRERFPYSENPAAAYSVSVNTLTALFASHALARPKADDEFRVLLAGDSSTWGWLLTPEQTYAAQINAAGLRLADGRRVVAYNIAYPIMSLTKDMMLLELARDYQPDLVVWLVSLESFPYDKQTFPPLVRENPQAVFPLIEHYTLNIDPAGFATPTLFDRTIIGQRRELADLLRLQLYGVSWAASGIDQDIPASYTPYLRDLPASEAFNVFPAPTTLTADHLAFDVLAAGIDLMSDVPVIIVNEPMAIADGANSDLRYNSLFPRWAYDQYRALLAEQAALNGWQVVDLWDSVDAGLFTDTPVHLSPTGAAQFAGRLGQVIASKFNGS